MRRMAGLTLLTFATAVGTASAQPAVPARTDRAPAKPKAAAPVAPVLEGVVRGPDRKPIENALVIAVAGSPWGPTSLMPVAKRTDAEGRFRIALKKHEAQTVRVEAAGLAARTLKNVAPGTALAIDLARGGTIEGTVRDGDTGQPLGGVRVEARDGSAVELRDEPEAGRVASATDAEGRFRLEGLAAGVHMVTARGKAAGFASQYGVRLGARVDLLMIPAATVAGTVTGPDGRPVAGARVHAVATTARRITSRADATDARGQFEISGLEGGEYDVVALAPGLAPAVATGVALDRRGEARVDLALLPGVRVTGRLVDERERPVPGRVLLGEIDGRKTPPVLGDRVLAEAGADGRFELSGVPPGENALAIIARGQAAERVDFTARATGGVVDLGDVRLEAGLVIRGRVRMASGAPVAGAIVLALGTSGGPMADRPLPVAETEADGAFVLAGLEQRTYEVTVLAPGFGKADKTVEPGGSPLDLVLQPAGIVAGLVVDERSRPVETFRVSTSAGDERTVRNPPRYEEMTSEDGRFALSDVSAGLYSVTVSSADYAPTTVSGVKVEPGGSADVGTIMLRAGTIVRGSVVDDDGAGVPGARVSASGAGRDWTGGGGPQGTAGTSDMSGAFELRGVPAGRTVLSASHPEHAAAEPVTVDVEPTKQTADVRLVLSQGGRLAGSVRRRDGSPIAGAMVKVYPARRGPRSIMVWDGELLTGADGSFAVEHVPEGRAQVTVMSPSRPGRFEGAQSRYVEVRNGETATVDIVNREILLSGRVTRSGAPAAGLSIEARGPRFEPMPDMRGGGMAAPPSGAPQRMHAVTRADGGFEMLLDEAGPVWLSVATADGRLRFPSREIDVPDADAHTVELNFSGVPVTGIVVDKDTDAPLPHASVAAAPQPPRPGGGSSGTSGPDGRFQLETEPGDYRIVGRVREGGYGKGELEVRVGEAGVADLRIALPKGLEITGRLTDTAGRAVGGVSVYASNARPDRPSYGFGGALADGTFRMDSLDEGTYHLIAETDAGTFAVRANVEAGTKNVALVLRPGGRVEVTVVTPSGEPVPGVWPRVALFDGLDLRRVGRTTANTNAQGSTVMLVPAGDVVIEARRGHSIGEASVRVAEGENASVRITLTAGSTPAP